MEQENCDFKALVKQVRRQLGLSQEDLARHLGVSYTTVNRWENGQSRPSKLAKAQFNAYCRNMTKQGRLVLPLKQIVLQNVRQD
jgi:DNA-binding transcriptional regulator YiaG